MKTTPLKAVLLDIDGTLLDSNDVHADAWIEALAHHGHTVARDRVRKLIGMGGDKVLDEVAGLDEESEQAKAISTERREYVTAHLGELSPTSGTRALLERLTALGLRLVVATSATDEELKGLLRQAGVEDLIDEASTSSDADASKPSPDVVMAALAKVGLEPNDVVMLGDTPYDIQAARAAGVDTIALRCGGWWDDAAFRDAVAIYDDPLALLEKLDESPIGQRLAAVEA